MATKKQSPAAPGSTGGSPMGVVVIIAALVVLVAGMVGYALRPDRPTEPEAALPAPQGLPSAPSVASALPAAPLPSMSQAALAGPAGAVGDATVAPVAAVTGGARLAADYSRLDFGKTDYLEQVEAEFTIKNVGDAPLQISDVSVRTVAGCWPPKPVVGSTTIAPGGTTTVGASFTMTQGMGGPHHFDLVVQSNDIVQPEQILSIVAEFPRP